MDVCIRCVRKFSLKIIVLFIRKELDRDIYQNMLANGRGQNNVLFPTLLFSSPPVKPIVF